MIDQDTVIGWNIGYPKSFRRVLIPLDIFSDAGSSCRRRPFELGIGHMVINWFSRGQEWIEFFQIFIALFFRPELSIAVVLVPAHQIKFMLRMEDMFPTNILQRHFFHT